jgi:uncharacterized Zn-binding protein involved in type VI secretion
MLTSIIGRGASRIGDINSAGGRILRGAKSVFISGLPAGLHVSPLTPHLPFSFPHRTSFTVTGSLSVFCERAPLLRVGSVTTCGHSIVQGSLTVRCP